MAVWHYRGSLVSRDGILRHHGKIPAELPGYRAVWNPEEPDESPTLQYNPPDVRDRVVMELPALLPPLNSWSATAWDFGSDDDHSVQVWEDGDIFFKLSLMRPDWELFRKLAELAATHRLLWVSTRLGRPIEPVLQAIREDMIESPAHQFCRDPQGYLLSLKDQHKLDP